MNPDPRSSEEIHEHAEYVQLDAILAEITKRFVDVDPQIVANYIDTVIPYDVLTHITQHHVRDIGPLYVNPILVKATYLPLSRMFIDGFLLGAKVQSQRDAAFLDAVTVPDDPAGLDEAA